jgi:predicted lipoprotein with Yx(FWY)xxD motif
VKTIGRSFKQPRVMLALPVVVLLLAAAACGSGGASPSSGSGAASPSRAPSTGGLVQATASPKLGGTVLTNRRGMTLYALSAERAGRFICTRSATVPGTTTSCLSLWKPLLVQPGTALSGNAGHLGTIRRPDGAGLQVTYLDQPLYTFTGDHHSGDVSGNGFRDVGTWRAVTVGAAASAATQPAATTPTYGGGY